MLNKFKFGKLKETSTVAAVMFFLFAVCVNWILVNVMLTIIIEGYERVKKELEGKGNELEVKKNDVITFPSWSGDPIHKRRCQESDRARTSP